MFLYIKKAISLYIKGVSSEEIKEMALQENLFQVNSETRKKEVATTVIQRINLLDPFLLQSFQQSTSETSKFIALYTVMKGDRLFFEFMNEVFKDKILYGDLFITDKDFNIFFQTKREQSDVVAKWKDYTFYKLQQVYIRILFESGLIKNQKGDREILVPLLDEDVKNHLSDKGERVFLEAMGVLA